MTQQPHPRLVTITEAVEELIEITVDDASSSIVVDLVALPGVPGPPGTPKLSEDPGNIAVLGSDSYFYVGMPTAGDVGADPAGAAAAAVAAHEAAADPHAQYLTAAEGDAAYAPLVHGHTYADLPADIATDADVSSAVVAHATGTDVHQMESVAGLRQALDGKAPADHTHQLTELPQELATDTDVAAAVAAHEAKPDPHPGYLTSVEGAAAYDPKGTAASAVAAHEGKAGAHPISGVMGLQTALDSKAPTAHNHDDRYYTDAEVDTALAGKADTAHNHDSRYYTESEVDTKLTGKSDTGHNHAGVYDPAGTAASAVTAHEAKADPHPQYLTTAEGGAAYEPIGSAIPKALLTTKGDLVARDATAAVRVPVGTAGQVLTADPAAAAGVAWATPYGNLLTANQASVETDTSGFVSVNGGAATLARTTAHAAHGSASLLLTSTYIHSEGSSAPHAARAGTTRGVVPVTAGAIYTGTVAVRAVDDGYTAQWQLRLTWTNGATVVAQSSTPSFVPNSTFATYSVIGAAPGGATHVSLEVVPMTYGSRGPIALDKWGLWRGAGGEWVMPGVPVPSNGVTQTELGPAVWSDRTSSLVVAADAARIGNLLTPNQASIESGNTVGLIQQNNTQLTVNDYSIGHGTKSVRGTLASSILPGVRTTPEPTRVNPNTLHTASVLAWTDSGSGCENYNNTALHIHWLDANKTQISFISSGNLPLAVTGTRYLVVGRSPSNAAYAFLRFELMQPVAGSWFNVDEFGLWEGAGGEWAMPGTPITGLGHRTNPTSGLLEAWNGTAWVPVQNAAVTMGDLNRALLAHAGVSDGEPWRQPTSALDAYPAGMIVLHDGSEWRSLIDANTTEPGDEADPQNYRWWANLDHEEDDDAWQPGIAYEVGQEVTYNGAKYTCIQAHTSTTGWEPPLTAALWQPVEGA